MTRRGVILVVLLAVAVAGGMLIWQSWSRRAREAEQAPTRVRVERRDFAATVLATGAVHHHLVRRGLRCDANLVIETGTARNSHECAVLIGYGATAVYPYMAYEVIQAMADGGQLAGAPLADLLRNYRKGVNTGLY